MQFYATLYVDKEKNMWWMTNGRRYRCTFLEFADSLGIKGFDKE